MNYSHRITPCRITTLNRMEVFVFGSNLAGRHGAGAAKYAREKFGAIYGKGIGLQGRSYAIPTKDENIQTLPLEEIQQYVTSFIKETKDIFWLTYLVTEIGCGLAGYKPEDIAPLFKEAIKVENICLPESFWKILIQ